MKIAVCVIGRLENLYAVEFVEHYKQLGVDKIFVYDNNHKDEEYFEDVLMDYINSGFVEVINWRDRMVCQLDAYQDCYDRFNKDFDWMCFFDFDEFLHINFNFNMKSLLSSNIYENFEIIHVNWLCYGDSDLVYYDPRPLSERFTKFIVPLDFQSSGLVANSHVKSIIRGGLHVEWTNTPHTPDNVLKCCNPIGEEQDSKSPFAHPYNFYLMYIKHYTTKTLDEYYKIKRRRGYPDGNFAFFIYNDWLSKFFTYNNWNEEKQKYIDEVILKHK